MAGTNAKKRIVRFSSTQSSYNQLRATAEFPAFFFIISRLAKQATFTGDGCREDSGF